MSDIVQYQGLGKNLGDTGVGRRLRWLFGKVKGMGITGAIIAAIGDAILDINIGAKFVPIDLTAQEEQIIGAWDSQKFTPFVMQLVATISNLSAPEFVFRPTTTVGEILPGGNGTASASVVELQLSRLNEILKKMAAVRQYYNDVFMQGISAPAHSQVIAYIDLTFQPFEKIIADTLAGFPYVLTTGEQTFPASSVTLAPLVPNGTLGTFVAPQYKSKTALPATAVIVPVITAQPTNNSLPGSTPVLPVGGATNTTTSATVGGIPYAKIVGGLAITGLLALVLRSKKKK